MVKHNSDNGIKIIVADDHPMFRKGLSNTLRNISSVKKVVEARDGGELLKLLKARLYNLVFLDIIMPILDGETVARTIQDKYPGVRTIVMSICDDPYTIRRLYTAGCDGYLIKNADESEIRHAIVEVMHGKKYYDNSIFQKIASLHEGNSSELENRKLTSSETRLIPFFCSEKTNKEIAKELYLSIRTVETHRYHIYNKTGVKNLTELVHYAVRHRII